MEKLEEHMPTLSEIPLAHPLQLELFTEPIRNENRYGRFLSLFDSLPIYVFGKQKREKIGNNTEYQGPMTRFFTIDRKRYKLQIVPAVMEENETIQYTYPGKREQNVMEVLSFLATKENRLFQGAETQNFGMTFTLRGIQKELKRRKAMASTDDIKRSLRILARTGLTITNEEEKTIDTNVLTLLNLGDDNGFCKNFLFFNPIHSQDLMSLNVRFYDYLLSLNLKGYERWLHRILMIEFRNCRKGIAYKIGLVDFIDKTGLTNCKISTTKSKIKKALKVLVEKGLVAKFQIVDHRDPHEHYRVYDATFIIYGTSKMESLILHSNSWRKRRLFAVSDQDPIDK